MLCVHFDYATGQGNEKIPPPHLFYSFYSYGLIKKILNFLLTKTILRDMMYYVRRSMAWISN